MCTSMTFQTKEHYYGRNMDLEYPFGERVLIVPRNYPISLRHGGSIEKHYAMIGMAAQGFSYPLYAEAANEKGLYMAGLNFPGNAHFPQAEEEAEGQIAVFELIPWLLGTCADVREACGRLKQARIVGTPYEPGLPAAPLHWHIADRQESVVMEIMEDGVHIYENPVGVLTNNPPFPFHMTNLNCYLNLTAEHPGNRFHDAYELKPFAGGMGAMGLPGDASSVSRFVRTAFYKANSACGDGEEESVAQVFHILDGVGMIKGSVLDPQGRCSWTVYSCCINADRGVYYFKTYENLRIRRAALEDADLEGRELIEGKCIVS